jgi:hypothetical protein
MNARDKTFRSSWDTKALGAMSALMLALVVSPFVSREHRRSSPPAAALSEDEGVRRAYECPEPGERVAETADERCS